MPMRPGQRVRECIDGDGAIDALTQLANRNPPISTIIDDLGRRVLNLPGVCLRNRTRTYALALFAVAASVNHTVAVRLS